MKRTLASGLESWQAVVSSENLITLLAYIFVPSIFRKWYWFSIYSNDIQFPFHVYLSKKASGIKGELYISGTAEVTPMGPKSKQQQDLQKGEANW